MKEQSPVAWLWQQLATILPTQDYLDLQIGYQEQQRRYDRQSRLNTARRELALYERIVTTYGPDSQQHSRYKDKIACCKATIACCKATIAQLESEQ